MISLLVHHPVNQDDERYRTEAIQNCALLPPTYACDDGPEGEQRPCKLPKKKKQQKANKVSTMGTCYAHACATAIQSVEASIYGRKPKPYDELITEIVYDHGHGIKGADSLTVLSWYQWYNPSHPLRWRSIDEGGISRALRGNPLPRVVLMSFRLPDQKSWAKFSKIWYDANPNRMLTAADIRDEIKEGQAGFWSFFGWKKEGEAGHAVAIVAETDNAWVIKNSWGDREEADADGYFLISKELELQQLMKMKFIDVYYTLGSLAQQKPYTDSYPYGRDLWKSASPQERRRFLTSALNESNHLLARSKIKGITNGMKLGMDIEVACANPAEVTTTWWFW